MICLYFDPIVFRPLFVESALLGGYFTAASVAIGLGFFSLSGWMLVRRPSALWAGLLAGGAAFAALLGLFLLPFSLLGLTMFIGVLGFTPFVTAFVFWRNAVRAYRGTRQSGAETPALALAALGLLFSGGVRGSLTGTSLAKRPAQWTWFSPRPAEAARGLSVLKRFRVLNTFDQIVVAYEAEENAEQHKRLAAFYKELTGRTSSPTRRPPGLMPAVRLGPPNRYFDVPPSRVNLK